MTLKNKFWDIYKNIFFLHKDIIANKCSDLISKNIIQYMQKQSCMNVDF